MIPESFKIRGPRVRFSLGRSFFDRPAVLRKIGKARATALKKAGAFVRKAAKSSIRKARKLRLSDLTQEQQEALDAANARRQKMGLPKQRPQGFVPSDPGKPPRSIFGLLREHIYFAYDDADDTVIVGPARLGGTTGTAPRVLEYGGITTRRGRQVTVRPRPFMGPALEQEAPKFPVLFRNSIR